METAAGRSQAEPLELVEALAHELRQPLSAIESTAYYLTMVLPRSEKRAQEHAAQLQRLVEQANWILNCALQLADASPLSPEPLDLEELITQTVASRAAVGCEPPRLDLAGCLPLVRLDPGRARQMIDTLLAMLSRASAPGHPVGVRTSPDAVAGVVLELAMDAGPEGPEACFGAGANFGIESVRRTVDAHGGRFHIGQDASAGVIVRIVFPPPPAS